MESTATPAKDEKSISQEPGKQENEETKIEDTIIEITFPPFSELKTDIVFYDVETTIPNDDIIEFAAIVIDRFGLFEKERYTTLIKSEKISKVSLSAPNNQRDQQK